MTRLLLRWLPVLVWMALIFYVSSMAQLPMVAPPFWQELLSSGAHFTEYAILVALLWRALPPARREPWPYWLSFVVAALYAASDEFHQSFILNRDASFGDLAVDIAGAALGLAAIFLWGQWRAKRRAAS